LVRRFARSARHAPAPSYIEGREREREREREEEDKEIFLSLAECMSAL
jgi:hypothetical protein